MEEKEIIKVTDENGNVKELEVVHCFELKSTGKNYVVYTDNVEVEDGKVIVSVSEIVESEDTVELKAVEDEAVVKEITEVLKELSLD